MNNSNMRFAPHLLTKRLDLEQLILALVNWEEAKNRGGNFILRWCDIWGAEDHTEEQLDEMYSFVIEDLEWLGISPDLVSRQSDTFDLEEEMLAPYQDVLIDVRPRGLSLRHQRGERMIFRPHHLPHDIMADKHLGCDPILLLGASHGDCFLRLYLYHVFGFMPMMYYLPFILLDGGESSVCEITVDEIRAMGWNPVDFKEFLLSCFVEPESQCFLVESMKQGRHLSLRSDDLSGGCIQ